MEEFWSRQIPLSVHNAWSMNDRPMEKDIGSVGETQTHKVSIEHVQQVNMWQIIEIVQARRKIGWALEISAVNAAWTRCQSRHRQKTSGLSNALWMEK